MHAVALLALSLAGATLSSAIAVTPGSKPPAGPGCPAPTRTATATPTTAAPPHTTVAPPECAITTTHTWYKGKSAGCQFNPDPNFCVADMILTLPCGCTKATDLVQTTTTVCAKSEGAVNCQTGFMFTTTAANC